LFAFGVPLENNEVSCVLVREYLLFKVNVQESKYELIVYQMSIWKVV
jgi:hypothetical protein